MTSDIKLDGDNIIIEGDVVFNGRTDKIQGVTVRLDGYNWLGRPPSIVCYAQDLVLFNQPADTPGDNSGLTAYALSHMDGDRLVINRGNSYKGGVSLEGNVGIGTPNPQRPLHVEGLEIHSGGSGAGFSFGARTSSAFVNTPSNGERWVWYSSGGTARLWSGGDKLSVSPKGNVSISGGNLSITGGLEISVPQPKINANVPGIGKTPGVDVSVSSTYLISAKPDTGNVGIGTPVPKFKLDVVDRMRVQQRIGGDSAGIWFYQATPIADRAFVGMVDDNHVGFWGNVGAGWGLTMDITNRDVAITGKVTASTITQTSSRTLKENIADLSAQEAVSALTDLNPVKFNFKTDSEKELHVGFIAEDVPELVAMGDRKTLSAMDIVAVLTKVVKEQQQAISQLTAEMTALKKTSMSKNMSN